MASADTLLNKLMNVNGAVVESSMLYTDTDNVKHIRIQARPNKWHQDDCPFCRKRCAGYDRPAKNPKVWRGLDLGSILFEIEYHTHRVLCPTHGVVTAAVPWAYPGSYFTKEFDLTVAWLAKYLPRSAVSNYMRIDWGRQLEIVYPGLFRILNPSDPEGSMVWSTSALTKPVTRKVISTSQSLSITIPTR